MAKNVLLSEAEFDDFQSYCRKKGVDLAYFSGEISGSKEEIEQHQFDGPQVIKLCWQSAKVRHFGTEHIMVRRGVSAP